jgi:hypothetical protein
MFIQVKTYFSQIAIIWVVIILFMQVCPTLFCDNPAPAGWILEIEENLPENEKESETKQIESIITEINNIHTVNQKDNFYSEGNFFKVKKNYDLQMFHNIFTPPEIYSVVL